MAKQTFRATTIHPGQGTQVQIRARDHQLIADEPPELGGTDTGANPVEILLGALGACQSVVAQVYAEKFGITYDELRIELEGDIDLDGFLDAADVRPGYSEVRYTYIVNTDAPEDKVGEWLAWVQSHCPVDDTIRKAVGIAPANVVIKERVSAAA